NTGTDTATAGDLTFSTDTTEPVVEIEAITPIDSDNPADGVADQVLITGTSDEPNAPVVIKDKDGNTIWEGETDGTGAFSATVDTAAVQAGDDVTVEVTDKAGNTGTDTATAGDLTFSTDTTEPVVEIEAITPIDSDNPADGVADQVLITGTSDEPNAPVVIKDKDGNTIWEGET
ncbi:MAG: Ig-like domain-containing protein, partial [Clostridia bacterium]